MTNPKLPWINRRVAIPIWVKLAVLVIAWRLFLLFVGFIAPNFIPYQPSFPYAQKLLELPLPQYVSKWGSFDGVHYLTIIEQGYIGTGLIQAFFPAFPLLIKLIATLASSNAYLLTGLSTNLLLTWLAVFLAWKLLKLDGDETFAWWGVVVLLLFPSSLFLAAYYSEPLYLALSLGALLAARKNHWYLSALLVCFASATRITGIFLLLPLLWEYASSQHWIGKQLLKKLPQQLTLSFVGALGLLGYMYYLWRTFGDPVYFLHVQSEFGAGRSESIIWYPQVIWRYIKMLLTVTTHDWKFFTICMEFLAGTIPVIATIKWWSTIRKSYLLYAAACFLLPTITGTFSSMPRYLLIIWPIFIGLASWSRRHRPSFILYLIFSSLLLIINTILFIQGYWVA